jgi:non-ribosomal peptide synthetase component F
MYDERSIPRSRPVAIWLDKSIELHLAILATTFAGAPWLPFDQEVPVDRVSTCLDDSSASILLCDKAHYDRARTASATRSVLVLPFDDLATLAVEVGTDGLELSQPAGTETAYMIYTSGSTGTPKGIAISHLSAVTFACSERSVLGIQGTDVVWQGFSPAFDMFIEEV